MQGGKMVNEGAMMDRLWVLKARLRVGGPSWIVEFFTDEMHCKEELEVMQKQFPAHVFWVENDVGDLPWITAHGPS